MRASGLKSLRHVVWADGVKYDDDVVVMRYAVTFIQDLRDEVREEWTRFSSRVVSFYWLHPGGLTSRIWPSVKSLGVTFDPNVSFEGQV